MSNGLMTNVSTNSPCEGRAFILNTPPLRGTPLEEGNVIVGTPLPPLVKGGDSSSRLFGKRGIFPFMNEGVDSR